jgi:RNA polymerase sigma factor (sigma-70 family)
MDALVEYRSKITHARETDQKNCLVVQNLPLVLFLLKRFQKDYPNMDSEELVAAGNYGLVKAANNFDTEKQIRFSTYASTIIYREFLKCSIEHRNRGCRIPRKTYEQVEIFAAFYEIFQRVPSYEEAAALLSRKTRLPEDRYVEISNAFGAIRPYSQESDARVLADKTTVEMEVFANEAALSQGAIREQ